MNLSADVRITIPVTNRLVPGELAWIISLALAKALGIGVPALDVEVLTKCQCCGVEHPEAFEHSGSDEQYVTRGRAFPTADNN